MYKKLLRKIKRLMAAENFPLSDAISVVCQNKEYKNILSFTPSNYITKELQAISITSDELVKV